MRVSKVGYWGLVFSTAFAILFLGCEGNRGSSDISRVVPTNGNFLTIKKLLPFATADSVRIETMLASDRQYSDVDLAASILLVPEGKVLWKGSAGRVNMDVNSAAKAVVNVKDLEPRLWEPSSPVLYNLTVEARKDGRVLASRTVCFGFRTFEIREGQFYLNGHPILLRGNAINPPERNIPLELGEDPQFVRDYVGYLKSINVNAIRMSRHSQVWFDVCDELGMMVFQGNYGRPAGGTASEPPTDVNEAINWYKERVFEPLTRHPSVVIYILSNEQPAEEIQWSNKGAAEYREFFRAVHSELLKWDSTRPYIGNAGYGLGREGDICDIHRYWGWYYGSFLNYLTLRDAKNFLQSERPQPITMTECIGNYTGVDGRFNLCSETKQPDAQKNWTGHAPDSEQSERALDYQAFMAKQAIEIYRRTRSLNPMLCGIMPFTIMFHNWNGISDFSDMKPKPIAKQYAISYQPILLSWELWTGQVYAGGRIRPVAHIVNDSDDFSDLSGAVLLYKISSKSGENVLCGGRLKLPEVRYFDCKSVPIEITLPESAQTGDYVLSGEVLKGGKVVSRNSTPIFIAQREFGKSPVKPELEIALYDPVGRTASALKGLEIPFKAINDFDGLDPRTMSVVIGEEVWSNIPANAKIMLRGFIIAGGRVLCLRQGAEKFDISWLPVKMELRTENLITSQLYPGGRPFKDAMAVNPERPQHPVFDGLTRDRLFLWSDYTGWEQNGADYPKVFPVTDGFTLADKGSIRQTAVLADYDHGLEGIGLCEIFDSNGSVMVSGFDIVNRAALDPAADRLLSNMVVYTATRADHYAHPLIDSPIIWGDYASERGLITGIYNGLILNTVPVVPKKLKKENELYIDAKTGFQFAGEKGGWNSNPSIQYVAKGRRPFGPYNYSLGGTPKLEDPNSRTGSGTLWARIPPEKTVVITKVENPSGADCRLEVVVNEKGSSGRINIPAGKTLVLRNGLPAGVTDVSVRYTGDRRLVLLETSFE